MPHLLAIGGLLPQVHPGNGLLIDYCLQLTGKSRPALGFIGTASGDASTYRERFGQLARAQNCDASDLPLFERTPDVADWVSGQDVIFVGGGNTKSMLAVWHEWQLPLLLREAWQRGTVLAGWSAGAICWFDQGVTDSFAGRLESLECLGFLPGSCCPHYSGEVERRPAYHDLITSDRITGGLAIDDGAGVHFVDQQPHAVVAIAEGATAHKVQQQGGRIVESPLGIAHRLLLADGDVPDQPAS